MSLVQSNKNKKIPRGPSIRPENSFKIDATPIEQNTYTPKPTTLKIDTKLRDQINALSLIGYGETQKNVLELMIDNVLESMTLDERRKFDVQYQVLEDKTRKTLDKSST